MTRVSLRAIVAPLFGAAMCLILMPHIDAARTSPILEQFVGRAVSILGDESAGRIDIYIERWSTDDEADSLRAPLTAAPRGDLLAVLQRPRPRAGVILMPGIQGLGARARTRTPRNLMFAREALAPAGRQVIVAADEHVGLGESPRDARRSIAEFNLVDIRFGPDGTGVGKVAAAADVAYSAATRAIEVKDFANMPARLIDVRSEKP